MMARRCGKPVGTVLVWLGLVGLATLVASAATVGTARAAQGDAALAERLYHQECVQCHGTSGEGTHRGPALTKAGAASADFYLRSGRMPLAYPDAEAKRGAPHFNDAQIRALVDYVAGLGEGPAIPSVHLDQADESRGGDRYRLECASCHNWDAKGGALVGRENAPPLHGVPPTQVAEAMRVGPGSMPSFSEDVLSDEAMNDVVAYVRYLDEPQDAGGYGLAHWGPVTEAMAAFLALAALLLVTGWLGSSRQP